MANNSARIGKWFDLIQAMLDGRDHTSRELSQVLGTTLRNLYYVFHTLGELGFRVVHHKRFYYIDRDSPFLRQLSNSIDFTEAEAAYLHGRLCDDVATDAMAGTLKRKLERFYHLDTYADLQTQQRLTLNVEMIEQAIAQKRVAILHDYASPHSHSVTDRVVEPFLLQGDRVDVRAYELKSRQNKTFKIARIGHVEVVDTPWFNEAHHRHTFTDMFMFSGEERQHITLRFSLLAHRLMLEEYPHSAPMMTRDDDAHWLFETEVVSYVGIARFILGLYDEIEVIGDSGLQQFLQAKIARMQQRS